MFEVMMCIISCCFVKIRSINVHDEKGDRQLEANPRSFFALDCGDNNIFKLMALQGW